MNKTLGLFVRRYVDRRDVLTVNIHDVPANMLGYASPHKYYFLYNVYTIQSLVCVSEMTNLTRVQNNIQECTTDVDDVTMIDDKINGDDYTDFIFLNGDSMQLCRIQAVLYV